MGQHVSKHAPFRPATGARKYGTTAHLALIHLALTIKKVLITGYISITVLKGPNGCRNTLTLMYDSVIQYDI